MNDLQIVRDRDGRTDPEIRSLCMIPDSASIYLNEHGEFIVACDCCGGVHSLPIYERVRSNRMTLSTDKLRNESEFCEEEPIPDEVWQRFGRADIKAEANRRLKWCPICSRPALVTIICDFCSEEMCYICYSTHKQHIT